MSPSWKQVTECARHTERYLQGGGKRNGLGECNKSDNYVHVHVVTYFVIEMSIISSKNIYRISKPLCDWIGIGLERKRHPRMSSCCFTTYRLLFELLDLGSLHWNKRSQTTMNKKTDIVFQNRRLHVNSCQVNSSQVN